MGACLPFLAQIVRKRVLEMLSFLSTFGSRTTSLLRMLSRPATSTRGNGFSANGSRGARQEEYEMSDNDDRFPSVSKTSGVTSKADSVRELV
jgi:hypothetical protein